MLLSILKSHILKARYGTTMGIVLDITQCNCINLNCKFLENTIFQNLSNFNNKSDQQTKRFRQERQTGRLGETSVGDFRVGITALCRSEKTWMRERYDKAT